MRILICTGIYPPDIGGPAIYAKNLAEEFLGRGYKVKVLSYKLEKKFPIGIRHCLYFFRVVFNLHKTDLIIALDTFSVGLPAVLAAKICEKKIIIRVGGDFLWESYVEETGDLITLKNFYGKPPALSVKLKFILKLSKFILRNCAAIVFSTEWQKNIFEKNYGLNPEKSFIIENFYPARNQISNVVPPEKIFLWAGRRIKLKNIAALESSFEEVRKRNSDIKLELSWKDSRDELMEKIKNCYAVILPSLTDVSPNFILEAISANKPFVLTKETGFYEKLKDVGIFVNPSDREDIKNKILFLSNDKNYSIYKEKIANFNFTHSWQEIADEFLDIYKKILAPLEIQRGKNKFYGE